ncbi:MAG: hypothetical protein HYV28_09170 [Ignavibacteriales bacterium]|nr:hypothetical protein [Ignavibacteriales bacterium]
MWPWKKIRTKIEEEVTEKNKSTLQIIQEIHNKQMNTITLIVVLLIAGIGYLQLRTGDEIRQEKSKVDDLREKISGEVRNNFDKNADKLDSFVERERQNSKEYETKITDLKKMQDESIVEHFEKINVEIAAQKKEVGELLKTAEMRFIIPPNIEYIKDGKFIDADEIVIRLKRRNGNPGYETIENYEIDILNTGKNTIFKPIVQLFCDSIITFMSNDALENYPSAWWAKRESNVKDNMKLFATLHVEELNQIQPKDTWHLRTPILIWESEPPKNSKIKIRTFYNGDKPKELIINTKWKVIEK